MAKKITVSDVEPAHDWLNKLAREAGDDRLVPEEYDLAEVKTLAIQLAEQTLSRKDELYAETKLSDREAEGIALKEAGLTHQGIALVMSLTDDSFEAGAEPSPSGTRIHTQASDGTSVAPSTVDEYMRRARQKYLEAAATFQHLDDMFYTSENWECDACLHEFDLTEYDTPPRTCPNCDAMGFLEMEQSK